MNSSIRARAGVLAAALLLGLLASTLQAATNFPALERSALKVRVPEHAVLLAAVMAGARIVAVGERGIVLLSDDGGTKWRQAKQVPVSVTLTAVRFVDAKRGWAVGHAGVILHSDDGGETWSRQADGRTLAKAALDAAQQRANGASNDAAARQIKAAQLLLDDGPDKPLFDLHFSDARHGFVVGSYNLFFQTEDGGATWKSAIGRLDNPKALHLYAIRKQDEVVVIVGEQGLMQRSVDGGRTFVALTSPYKGSWFSLAALSDGAWLVAGLRGNAFRSSDNGQNWQRIEGAAPVSFVSIASLPDGAALLTNQAGQLLSSRVGASLVDLGLPSLPPLADVLPLSDGSLLAVGMAGAIRLRLPAATASGGGAR